jgi:SPP1 family holin
MDKGTVVRIILFALAWLNQFLVSKGQAPLPVLDEVVVAAIVTFIISLWTLWKNNYITPKGTAQKKALERQNLE